MKSQRSHQFAQLLVTVSAEVRNLRPREVTRWGLRGEKDGAMLLVLLLGGVVALVLLGMLVFSMATGEPPTPRRMMTGFNRRIQALKTTYPYGSIHHNALEPKSSPHATHSTPPPVIKH